MAGRTPVLNFETDAGPITYSLGSAPSAIWRKKVLMRCGPSYGLDGLLNSGGSSPNRVVIDGLMSIDEEPFVAEISAQQGSLYLALTQCFDSHGGSRMIREQRALDLTGLQFL